MRHLVRENGSLLVTFVLFLVVFAGLAGTLGPDPPVATRAPVVGPAQAIPLPPPGEDADRDTYADAVDVWDGDLVVAVNVTRLRVPGGADARPYLLAGTQDDQWRSGAGAELEWRRVYDHDPFGHAPGSREWLDAALRTGAWWRSIPLAGETHAVTRGAAIDEDEPGAIWPQTLRVNVRDDRPQPAVEVELWDAAPRPSVLRGAWRLEVDFAAQTWRAAPDLEPRRLDESAVLGTLGPGGAGIEISVALESELNATTKQDVAERWAPILHFAGPEALFPTRGDAMERFHGFWSVEPDYRTWALQFNNARDGYRLLLADFTGDGIQDHRDVVVLTDVLRSGGAAPDTVYAHVTRTTTGFVVVQYWFIYFYNFVPDEAGRDVPLLAHAGDREFMQLVFQDLDAAQNGTPLGAAYSQHFGGVRTSYAAGQPPFHVNATRPSVFVALGSHASYPAAGTDEALRFPLAAVGDTFFGDGEVWQPGNYTVEVLGPQRWHAGYLYGVYTRHSRDWGTALRPLLQHGFAYPFMDPLHWESKLVFVEPERLPELYGGAP